MGLRWTSKGINGDAATKHIRWRILWLNEGMQRGISLVGASGLILLDTQFNSSMGGEAIGHVFKQGEKKIVFIYIGNSQFPWRERLVKTELKQKMPTKDN